MAVHKAIRVLVVEDDPLMSKIVKELVGQLNYELAGVAGDGAGALSLARELRPDVVLMDVGLPGMSGIQATRLLQQESPAPVVMLSAHDSVELVSEAGKAGAGAYVVKPPTAQELERAIAVAIARFKDLMELARLNRCLQEELNERHRADEALRLERDFVENLIETAQVIVLVLDTQGRILRFNRYMQDVCGYPLSELQGRDLFSSLIPERERQSVRENFERARGSAEFSRQFTSAVTSLEGRERLIDWTVKPLCDRQGELLGVLCTGQDVTERENMLAERDRLKDQLHQAQKMESIGRLAGGIAHDFNNLLTPMIGYAEMALLDLKTDDPLYADFEEIRDAAERAKNLTGQLLAFSRRQMLEMRVANLNDIITSFERMLQRIIGEDVEVLTHLDSRLCNVKADPPQIQQVLLNLSVNARDAMPEGGKLTIKTANVDVGDHYTQRLRDLSPGRYALLTVSDTGVGMSSDTLDRIFEPFFTTKAAGKGTGLGLATVYGIVKQHQGTIWVHSEPGRGTSFEIYLPQVLEEAEVEQAAQPGTKTRGKGTVLVVEDETAVRRLACSILRSHGYHVLEAEGSLQALQVVKDYQSVIDLLLTDVVMPQMNGRELQRQVSQLRPGIKVLYMSGYSHEVVAHHGMLEAGIQLLQKPFSVERLVRKVREMLEE